MKYFITIVFCSLLLVCALFINAVGQSNTRGFNPIQGYNTFSAGIKIAAAQFIEWVGRGKINSPADGKFGLRNNGNTANICLDVTTDNRIKLYGAADCSGNANGAMSGSQFDGINATDGNTGLIVGDAQLGSVSGYVGLNSVGDIMWSNTTLATGTKDVGISRESVGDICVQNGNFSSPTCYYAIGTEGIRGYGNTLVSPVARTTDAAPYALNLTSGDAYPVATGANQNAGSIFFAPGIGSKRYQIDNYANCAGDTITITVNTIDAAGTGVTSTVTTCTEGAGAGCRWTAATSNAVTATSLAGANGLGGVANITVTANGDYVDIVPNIAVLGIGLAEGDATCSSIVNGAAGQTLIGNGTAAVPMFGFYNDPDVGFYYDSVGIGFTAAGTNVASAKAGTFVLGETTTLTSLNTTFGCTNLNAANTACTTTCTTGCLFGQDTDAATKPIVACTDNTADRCICCK